MFRIGSTMRSAKMNEITPPKLMPPFQSTAASGTLPIEQKERLPETFGHPCRQRAGEEQPAGDVPPYRDPVHHEVVADGCETTSGRDALPQRAFGDRHVHLGVAFHRADETPISLTARLFDQLATQERAEQQGQDRDHR